MDSISAVTEALNNSYASVQKPCSVLVGLSGGADSVALLVSLCELKKQTGMKLAAVHVNHGLRQAAVQDEAYCKALCDKLNVPLYVEAVSVTAKSNIEAEARKARYQAFDRAMAVSASQLLALAHHQDDQAETMLLHLLYGAGSTGLGGMRELNGMVWRPFLHVRRSQLQDYLKKRGYAWQEDESNLDLAFTRNKIRATILPAMEACAPEAVSSMSKAAMILQEEDDYLSLIADKWLSRHASATPCAFLFARPLMQEHPAIQRRVIRAYAQTLLLTLDFSQTERVRQLLHDSAVGKTENLPCGWQAFRTRDRLHFVPPQGTRESNLGSIEIRDQDALNIRYAQLIPDSEAHDLTLRTRKAGDMIQPFGMQGKKTLKEYMIDHALDKPFRDHWPLICRGNEVLWVVGIGASEKLRVRNIEAQGKQLIYLGKLPDEIQEGD